MVDITLISGSTLGSTEYIAEHLAKELREDGFSTKTFHGPLLENLPIQGIWLLISSTHGIGELPDNLQPFYKELQKQQTDLSQVRYGAIGIGSRDYDIFCGAIDKVDTVMNDSGAKKLGETLKINVLDHNIPEDLAEEWLDKWKGLLKNT